MIKAINKRDCHQGTFQRNLKLMRWVYEEKKKAKRYHGSPMASWTHVTSRVVFILNFSFDFHLFFQYVLHFLVKVYIFVAHLAFISQKFWEMEKLVIWILKRKWKWQNLLTFTFTSIIHFLFTTPHLLSFFILLLFFRLF